MLDSQPLGFYSPSQLVQDARRHGVTVHPVCVLASDWLCTLEPPAAERPLPAVCPEPVEGPPSTVRPESVEGPLAKTLPGFAESPPLTVRPEPVEGPATWGRGHPAVRLGLRQVHGLPEAAARRITAARADAPFTTVEDLAQRAGLDAGDLKALAAADALAALAGHRRQQVWDASALHRAPALLRAAPTHEDWLDLPEAPEGEAIVHDYAATGLTLRRHPLALLRPRLAALRLQTAAALQAAPDGRLVRACGIVTVRQQPGTAKGVVFVTLEDETGTVNVIVWKALRERFRRDLLHARLLAVHGTWQRDEATGGQVRHLIAGYLKDLTPLLGRLADAGMASRDFR
jgi:error-prone DNA polymerase